VRLATVTLAALVAALAFAWPAAAKDQTQQFFEGRLLADKHTSKAIKTLLRTGGGFVDKRVVFRDVTGDKRTDAIVRVQSGGVNGVVAVYVFSTANKKGGKLRAIFRSQTLTRASTRVVKDVVSYRTSRYAPDDELCCPSQVTESTLGYDKDARRMRVTSRITFTNPPPAPAA
jgi:lipopolysaccharide export LptBFGC system permease protein LptF